MKDPRTMFEDFITSIGAPLTAREKEAARLAWNAAIKAACDHVGREEGTIFRLDEMYVWSQTEVKAAKAEADAEEFARQHTIKYDHDDIDCYSMSCSKSKPVR